VDLNEVKELIRLLEESQLTEIEIEDDDRRIRLSKQTGAPAYTHIPVAAPAPAAAAPVPEPAAQEAAPEEGALPPGTHTIDSPMVGTFYASPAPGDPPFVLPGQRVEAETTVCIVEAMKIMNEVVAHESCIIEQVLVENGQPVEFGQPLFAVRRVS
jgi:acetyl-CoA carboxylase biotin carboxyl carrier protein